MSNIYDKLASIRKMVEVLYKSKSGFNYTYVPDEDVLAKVTAGLAKYNVDVYPRIVPGTTEIIPVSYTKKKILKNGNVIDEDIHEYIVKCEAVFTWVDLDDPKSQYEVPWVVMGQQSDISQAFGSGLTYCNRYFFLKFFKASTTSDDPDNWRSRQKEAIDKENEAVVKELINQINAMVQSGVNDDNRDAVTALIKKNVIVNGKQSANYMNIKDLDTATNLLKALSEFFSAKEKKVRPKKTAAEEASDAV